MKFISQEMTQKLGRQILKAKASSPKWMFAAGIVGVVGSAILACKATLKLERTLDEFTDEIDSIKSMNPDVTKANPEDYSKRQYNRDMTKVYAKGSLDLIKLYAPAIVIGGLSIAALTTSHVTLTRRNTALTAAYSALQTSYNSYRERVRAEIGEEKERDIYQSATYEKVKEGSKTETVRDVNPRVHSPYARCFDESSTAWVKNAEMNKIFVQVQQNLCNHLLASRGHLFLNEVYDMLGLERSASGQVVGWVLNAGGDNFVDFNIYHPDNSRFVNGLERSIWLDFNVDGVVYDKLEKF